MKNSSEDSDTPLDLSKYPQYAGLSESEAKEMLWRRGSLSWKLDSLQKKLYRKFKSTDHLINVWNVSRQTGKTFALTILAIETCLSIPGAQVKYCSGDAKSVNKMIKPNIRNLLKECPPDIAPKWKQHGGHYEFPNGSLLYLEGIDGGKADSIRGTPAHLLIVDEAGFISDLEYAKGSVLIPMTTTTNGRILIVSTPPKSAGHDIVGIIKQAEHDGAYIKRTIYDRLEDCKNDHPYFRDRIPAEMVAKMKQSTRPSDWEREFLCRIITDSEHAVIPEFTEELKNKIVVEHTRPRRFDAYVSMDLGTKDLTAIVWAYFDFINNKLVIEDEFSINGSKVTSSTLANNIREIERKLYRDPNTGFQMEPYRRICDNNETIARQDLATDHDIRFVPTRKDDKDAALHALRDRLEKGQILINPKCTQVIFHLQNATWNKNKTSFDRSPDNGHYDFIDSLIYLVRNVDWHRNPYPKEYREGPGGYFREHPSEQLTGTIEVFKNIFKKK